MLVSNVESTFGGRRLAGKPPFGECGVPTRAPSEAWRESVYPDRSLTIIGARVLP